MEVTHSVERKQIKAIHTINLHTQQKIEAIHTIKLQVQQNLKWKLLIQQTTLLNTYNYFKVWDRRQLNPTYTPRISSYQHLGLL